MAIQEKNYEIDMTTGPLLPSILKFTIPLIFSGILQLLFNAADIIVVGQFSGPNSIAAVGSTSAVINLLISAFMGLAVGVNVLAARYFATKDEIRMQKTVHTSVTLSFLLGIVLAVIGILAARPILAIMGTPVDVIDLAELYMRIYFAGMPVIMLYNFGAGILRAVGDTKRPLYYLTAAGIINILLNLVFVILFHMDVAGVALATILSEAFSALLVCRCLMRIRSFYRLDPHKLGIDRKTALSIAKIGLPAGLQGAIFSLSNTLIQSSVNSFGSTFMAGNAAAQNLEGFVYIAMNSVYQGCISFTSANYGVRNFRRIRKILLECLLVVTVIGLTLGGGFYLAGHYLLGIYTSDPATIGYGLIRMRYICIPYFLCGIMDTLCGSIRGLGRGVLPMIVSLIGACAFRIVWIFTVFQIIHTPNILYNSYPISWLLTAITHFICFMIIIKKEERGI